jgi:hypothetical protein
MCACSVVLEARSRSGASVIRCDARHAPGDAPTVCTVQRWLLLASNGPKERKPMRLSCVTWWPVLAWWPSRFGIAARYRPVIGATGGTSVAAAPGVASARTCHWQRSYRCGSSSSWAGPTKPRLSTAFRDDPFPRELSQFGGDASTLRIHPSLPRSLGACTWSIAAFARFNSFTASSMMALSACSRNEGDDHRRDLGTKHTHELTLSVFSCLTTSPAAVTAAVSCGSCSSGVACAIDCVAHSAPASVAVVERSGGTVAARETLAPCSVGGDLGCSGFSDSPCR